MLRQRLESLVKSIVRSIFNRFMEGRRRAPGAAPRVPVTPKAAATMKPAPTVSAKAPGGAATGKLTAESAHHGTVWIPRILWALQEADGQGGKTAAELARILATEAKLKVAPNNVARAFRDLKGKPYAKGLWTVRDKKYTITKSGQALLVKIL